MPRNCTAAYIQALGEPYLFPAVFLALTFASGPVYLWSGYQDQLLNGNVYKGVGSFLSVSTIEDGSSVQARGITVSLSGIDPTLLPATLNEFQVGLPATIYLGLFGAESGALTNDTIVAWSGRTDQPTITVSEKTATISINLETRLLDMNTPVALRYTQVDQQRFAPGDLGFSWVNSIQSIPVYWNQTATSSGNP